MRRAAELLVGAKAPLIIADFMGRKPAAVAALAELAELLAIPVIDKGNRHNIANNHPLDVTNVSGDFLKKADVVLGLDVQDLYGSLTTVDRTTREMGYVIQPGTKIIHINLNDMLVHSWATDVQPLQAVDVPISADTAIALPELTRLCRELMGSDKSAIEARAKEVKAVHDAARARWQEEARQTLTRNEITTACLGYELGEAIKREDWVLANGSANGWARKLWDWTKPGQYLGRSGGAGVGYGMSAAIGVALGHMGTDKFCVDIQSDGDPLDDLQRAVDRGAPQDPAAHRHPQQPVLLQLGRARHQTGGVPQPPRGERRHRHPRERSAGGLRQDGRVLRGVGRRPHHHAGGVGARAGACLQGGQGAAASGRGGRGFRAALTTAGGDTAERGRRVFSREGDMDESEQYRAFAEAVSGPEMDLARVALTIALPEYPELDVGRYLARLDELAESVGEAAGTAEDAYRRLACLDYVLFKQQGFKGNAEDYYDPENSFLNRVVDRKTGIPITLSVLYMEVARRVGLEVRGVGFPGHFLVKTVCDGEEVFVDPFHGGSILSPRISRGCWTRCTAGGSRFSRSSCQPCPADRSSSAC